MTPDQRDFSPPEPSVDDLFAPGPAASPAEVRAAVAAQMGEDVPRAPRPEYPGISELARGLNLK